MCVSMIGIGGGCASDDRGIAAAAMLAAAPVTNALRETRIVIVSSMRIADKSGLIRATRDPRNRAATSPKSRWAACPTLGQHLSGRRPQGAPFLTARRANVALTKSSLLSAADERHLRRHHRHELH